MIRFLKCKSDAAAGLSDTRGTHITPVNLKVGSIRTGGEVEFTGPFKYLLDNPGIRHERTPPYTPRYNRVVKRALDLLRKKTVGLLRGVTEWNGRPTDSGRRRLSAPVTCQVDA